MHCQVGELLAIIDDCLVLHNSGHQHIGAEMHPLLSMLEGACTAFWGAVLAEVRAPRRVSSSAGTIGKDKDRLSLEVVSRLACTISAVVLLLGSAHARDKVSTAGQQQQDNDGGGSEVDLSSVSGSVVSGAASVGGKRRAGLFVDPLASSLYCLVGALAVVHQSPELLARAHAELMLLHANLQQQHLQTGTENKPLVSFGPLDCLGLSGKATTPDSRCMAGLARLTGGHCTHMLSLCAGR